jgi:hypothetical protein
MSELINLSSGFSFSAASAAVQIFDPPMCCPTGLCGPALDQTLLDVSEMVLQLQVEGIEVERFQMTSHPQAFLNDAEVMRLIREKQMEALPVTVVNGQVIKTGVYPILSEIKAGLSAS